MSDHEPEILDDTDQSRFLYREDGAEAELIYRVNGKRLVLVHTEVPDALGGRGLGGHLVRAAVKRAEETGETVVPWCPFARKWLREHPDVTARITVDWSDPPRA